MTNLEIAKDQLELVLNEIKNTLTVEQGELIHDYVSEALKQVKNCSIPDVVKSVCYKKCGNTQPSGGTDNICLNCGSSIKQNVL